MNLAKWFVQTVIFSLLPLIFYLLLHWMFRLKEDPTSRYISELAYRCKKAAQLFTCDIIICGNRISEKQI